MENKKDIVALDDELLSRVSGGGVGEAEMYLDQLMLKYGCSRSHLFDIMSREECEHYVYLFEK